MWISLLGFGRPGEERCPLLLSFSVLDTGPSSDRHGDLSSWEDQGLCCQLAFVGPFFVCLFVFLHEKEIFNNYAS